MQNRTNNGLDYYKKTFVLIQSSRISKSRLVDVFGKSCLMINFIFCKNNDYSLGDTKILQFIFSKPSNEVNKSINKLPPRKIITVKNFLVKARNATKI